MVLYAVLVATIKVIAMNIMLGCKNDANPPAVLELWVLEFVVEHKKWWKIGTNHRISPKMFILYKYNNFLSMWSLPYGLFILVDYPLISNLKVDKYITIYIIRLISLEILEAGFFCPIITHDVVKKTGLKIGQQKISP